MGKFLGWLLIIFIMASCGGYYYYTKTGYKFGLEDTFLFKNTIRISSQDFIEGEELSSKFTCDGENISPTFTLDRVPNDTKTLALVLEDQSISKKPFTHWLVFNINPDIRTIDSSTIWLNGTVGINDFRHAEYEGPCPSVGAPHKYKVQVYALNNVLTPETPDRVLFDKITEGHILATGSIIGSYSKKPQ